VVQLQPSDNFNVFPYLVVKHVSPGSAQTLVRGGGKINNDLVAYSLSNISAKNYQNRLMDIRIIAHQVSVFFLRHHVSEQ